MSVVQGCIQFPISVERMVYQQLTVQLVVNIILVFIKADISFTVRIHSAGIERTSVLFHLFFAGIVPGMIGLFFSSEDKQFYGCGMRIESSLCEERLQMG